MNVKEAAERWNLSERRVRVLCANGQIDGVFRRGKLWIIPDGAEKPADGRIKAKATLLELIAQKKVALDKCRPLTEGEVQRLYEDFMIEYTYNSNAIEGNTLTLRETDMVLRGLTIDKKPLKDHMEAVGHKEAFWYICDLVKEKAELSEYVIKQIHTLVLADKPLEERLEIVVETPLHRLELVADGIDGFRDDGVENHLALGAVLRRARGAELELVAGEGERRRAVAVGRVARQRRQRINTDLERAAARTRSLSRARTAFD